MPLSDSPTVGPDDARRLERVRETLRDVLPPTLPLTNIEIELNDLPDASARRFRGVNQLSVGRPLLDALSDAETLTGYLAHEVGHLVDPRLQRKWIPFLGMCTAALAAVLLGVGVIPGPRVLLAAVPFVLFGFLIAELAIVRGAELAADRLAAQLSSPQAIHAALLFIKAGPHGSLPGPVLFSTHPAPEQRLAQLRSLFPTLAATAVA